MQEYNVTGMTCAACVNRVEKAVNNVKGVKTCTVSLLTNSMGVEGDVSASEIIKAVEDAGYSASLKGQNIKDEEVRNRRDNTPKHGRVQASEQNAPCGNTR